jgi:transaldolase
MEAYKHLFDNALEFARSKSQNLDEQVSHALDKLAVNFGVEILKIVPGRVSTEIDARLSYDTEGTLKKCYELKKLYEGKHFKRFEIFSKMTRLLYSNLLDAALKLH